MKQLLRITATSHLLLGNKSGISNYQGTTDYIPGSALRGALAARFIEQQGADTPEFNLLFGTEGIVFGNAYPANPGPGPVWPYPATARTCKRYGGWPLTAEATETQHGVWDTLFADFAYLLASDPTLPGREQIAPGLTRDTVLWKTDIHTQGNQCGYNHPAQSGPCGYALEPTFGNYAWGQARPQPVRPVQVSRATHVGINRSRSVAEDALLFTQETLAEGAYWAELTLTQAQKQVLQPFLDGTHYVGRGRSRGYGAVTMAFLKRSDAYPSLEERLTAFQLAASSALAAYHQENKAIPRQLNGQLFSLTVRAPAVVASANESYRFPPPEVVGLPAGVIPVCAWARTEMIGGWHSAARVPRRTRQAIRAGSVFLYFAPAGQVDEPALRQRLSQIEQAGIGAETQRGYGATAVCAAFHVHKRLTQP